jgi:hypothetical protein
MVAATDNGFIWIVDQFGIDCLALQPKKMCSMLLFACCHQVQSNIIEKAAPYENISCSLMSSNLKQTLLRSNWHPKVYIC